MEPCKKHPCPDCSFCQFCSETRCNACRKQCRKGPKLSIREQIEMYERINCDCKAPDGPIYYRKTSSDEDSEG